MSGFEETGTNIASPALFAAAPKGEPTFVFIRDDVMPGKESSFVQVATLGWVREQFYDFLQDGQHDTAIDYLEAYIKIEGTHGLQRCDLGTTAGKKSGDGPRLMVYNNVGVLALYDI